MKKYLLQFLYFLIVITLSLSIFFLVLSELKEKFNKLESESISSLFELLFILSFIFKL